MKTVTLEQTSDIQNPHGVSARRLHQSDNADIVHIRLAPGEGLKSHVTPVDVCFYILEGTPTVEIGEEEEVTAADELIESPADIPHRVFNDADSPARFLVIKTPGVAKTS
ncbi:MAG: cupin domain-containing protein [Phycisphaerae bacterium]